MESDVRLGRRWRNLPAGVIALGVAAGGSLPGWSQGLPEVVRGGTTAPSQLALPLVKRAEAPVPRMGERKLASADPGAVSASVCNACREQAGAARPLFPALPDGESYELRILRDAVHGFSFRLSDGESPGSADERLRIRISRQKIGISWQRSF